MLKYQTKEIKDFDKTQNIDFEKAKSHYSVGEGLDDYKDEMRFSKIDSRIVNPYSSFLNSDERAVTSNDFF